MPFDVLLTYGWCRSTYVAARSLHALGLKVTVADTHSTGMTQWSRFADFVGTYTDPLTDPKGFMRDVNELLERTGARFLLPGHDETEVLARFRDRLPAGTILPVAQVSKIELANNKARTVALARSLDLPVPEEIEYETLDDLPDALEPVDFPLVVKLLRGNSAKGVFYPVSNDDALTMVAALQHEFNLPDGRMPVIQRRVEGEGWGVSCLYWQGEHIASFTHRRLREKTRTGGTSTLRVSACNPQLEQAAHALLDELEWHGLAMVEFKYDPANHQGWFIEINPRLWGSIHLAVAAGVDFPKLLYVAATQGPDEARRHVRQYKEGIIARWYLGDVIAAAGALKRMQPLLALRMLAPGGADTIDDWRWDDPQAFFGQAGHYLALFLKTRSLNPSQEGMLG